MSDNDTQIQAILDKLHTHPTISVPELGIVTEISRASAYNAVRAGEIPSIRIGKRVRVPSAAVLAMLGVA